MNFDHVKNISVATLQPFCIISSGGETQSDVLGSHPFQSPTEAFTQFANDRAFHLNYRPRPGISGENVLGIVQNPTSIDPNPGDWPAPRHAAISQTLGGCSSSPPPPPTPSPNPEVIQLWDCGICGSAVSYDTNPTRPPPPRKTTPDADLCGIVLSGVVMALRSDGRQQTDRTTRCGRPLELDHLVKNVQN